MRIDSSTLERSAGNASSMCPSSADTWACATSSSIAIAGMSSDLASSAPSVNAVSAPCTSPTARRAWPRTRCNLTAASDGEASPESVASARTIARSGSPDTYSAVATVDTAAPATLLPSNGQRSIVWRPTITTSSERPWCTTAHMHAHRRHARCGSVSWRLHQRSASAKSSYPRNMSCTSSGRHVVVESRSVSRARSSATSAKRSNAASSPPRAARWSKANRRTLSSSR